MTTAIYHGVRFTAMSPEIKAAIARGTLFGLASIAILALLPSLFAINWREDRSHMHPDGRLRDWRGLRRLQQQCSDGSCLRNG